MKYLYVFAALSFLSSCGVYSFTGVTIPAEAETFSVQYFRVNAPLADPNYGQLLTEGLKDLILQQSRLDLTKTEGDLQFDGYVKEYRVNTSAATGEETASLNRLTISIVVTYENVFNEEDNFEQTFTRFVDFNANEEFDSIEEGLIEEINDQLLQDIFDKSLGNW
ncbi:MAG: LPS assembly lipoprotein LptE [Bacteroidota bacterium]